MKSSTLSKKIKTFLVGFSMLSLLLIPNTGDAKVKSLTFEWEQVISTDFAGWNLYYKQDTSGNGDLAQYSLLATIPYGGVEQPVYMNPTDVDSPDGTEITYFFVLTAFDGQGNESTASNEVSAIIDWLAPDTPLIIKVTVPKK